MATRHQKTTKFAVKSDLLLSSGYKIRVTMLYVNKMCSYLDDGYKTAKVSILDANLFGSKRA